MNLSKREEKNIKLTKKLRNCVCVVISLEVLIFSENYTYMMCVFHLRPSERAIESYHVQQSKIISIDYAFR
jgi:hypothetical protein